MQLHPKLVSELIGPPQYHLTPDIGSPRRSTLLGNTGKRDPKDGLRANEISPIIQAKIEGLTREDDIYLRVAQIYGK